MDNPGQLFWASASPWRRTPAKQCPFWSLLLLGQVHRDWWKLEDQEGWGGVETPWGLAVSAGPTPSLSLLYSPSLLQNTDLFEMIEKMQVRRALKPVLGEPQELGWAWGAARPALYLQPDTSLRTGPGKLLQTVPGGDGDGAASRAPRQGQKRERALMRLAPWLTSRA